MTTSTKAGPVTTELREAVDAVSVAWEDEDFSLDDYGVAWNRLQAAIQRVQELEQAAIDSAAWVDAHKPR